MRFSVIIPLYNKEMYIKETLDSVRTQSFRDFEVIVVNDSSTDKSLNIASIYENDNRYHVYTIPNIWINLIIIGSGINCHVIVRIRICLQRVCCMLLHAKD